MLKSLKVCNFRNISENQFTFDPKVTVIYGDNGKGKSSILEAICLLGDNSLTKGKPQDFVNFNQQGFFIEGELTDKNVSLSYEKISKKKQYCINTKKTTASKTRLAGPVLCVFSPRTMNMFTLGPKERRDFMDQLLSSSFPNYGKILQHYEKILKNRNALLRAIFENKGKASDLDFWDENFISAALEVYRYRYIFSSFFGLEVGNLKKYFPGKDIKIQFSYESKFPFNGIESELKSYLQKNRERDIIIQKTYAGPHLDDFQILINDIELTKFASRGEIKSVILGLKLLEAQFIEEKIQKKPIFLLDDFSSELDSLHKKLLLESLQEYQLITTNISKIDEDKYLHIYLP